MSRGCRLSWCTAEHDAASPASDEDHCSVATTVELTLDAVSVDLRAVAYASSEATRPLVVLRLEQGELADKDWALLAPDEALMLAEALRGLAASLLSGDPASTLPHPR